MERDTSHPVMKLRRRGPKKWMQGAAQSMKEKGTEGKFTAIARRRGMSTQEAASKLYDASGDLGKEARFAYIAEHKHGK
jgi:hypothetical protein